MIKQFIKRHKYMFIFLIGIFITGIIMGIIIYNIQNDALKVSIATNLNDIKNQLLNNHINNYYYHLIIVIIVSLLSLTVFGYFGGIIYLFYEGMSIGFTCSYLTVTRSLKGILFGLINNFRHNYLWILIGTIIIFINDLFLLCINNLILKILVNML